MTNVYDLPNATDSEGLFELFRYVNTVSGGIFFPVIMLVLYIVMFITMLGITTASRALTFTSFVAMVLVIPLAVMGLVAPSFMYLIILALAAGVLWTIMENG